MHHIGKVLKLYKGDGKGIIASDSSVQAYIEMWDENRLIISVHPVLNSEICEGDLILAKYTQPEPLIIKIMRGKQGEQLWQAFRKVFEERRKREKSARAPQPGFELEIPEERSPMGPMPMVR